MKKWLKPWFLPLFSGLMVGTTYIPFPPWALLFAYVPLFISLNDATTWKQILKRAWLTQFVLSLIGFHWVAHTVVEYGHLPLAVGLVLLFLFCSLIHLHIPIGALLWFSLKKKFNLSTVGNWLVLALSMASIEVIYPMLFPWHLGYTWLYAGLPGFFTTRIYGFEGLSLITWLLNALILSGFSNPASSWRKKLKPAFYAFAIFFAINAIGFGGLSYYRTSLKTEGDPKASSHRVLQALIIQANIGNYEKYLAERVTDARSPIMEVYERLTREAIHKYPEANVVVWPETAFPDNLDPQYLYGVYQTRFLTLVREVHRDFLVGSYSANPTTRKTYNGIFHFSPEGILDGIYRKRSLLAFGEYMPLGDLVPKLREWFPEVSDFERGTETNLLSTKDFKFGPLICYEGLFPPLSSEARKRGADVLLNLTNDSWFGNAFEPKQHMYMTLARAVEFGLPVLRSTNTGITTVAHPDGYVDVMGPMNQEWYHLYTIPLPIRDETVGTMTTFTYISPFIHWIFWLLLAVTVGVTRRGSISKS